jgi:hypothetical protein
MGMGIGIGRTEWQLLQNRETWLPVETSRSTPHYATPPRDINKMRNQNMIHVAVNTILGKGDDSFLAY